MQQRGSVKKVEKQRGFALIIGAVFIFSILLSLGVFGATMLATTSTVVVNSLEAIRVFYTAEAGLQDVLYRLCTNSTFRDNPPQYVNGSLMIENSTYNYTVKINKNVSYFFLNSTGHMQNNEGVEIRRRVSQIVEIAVTYPPAFDYAITMVDPVEESGTAYLGLGGTLSVNGNVFSDGEAYIDSGASVVNGYVYADMVSGTGNFTPAPEPADPRPTYPTYDKGWYQNHINNASFMATGNLTLGSGESMDLNNQTFYYHNIELTNDAQVNGAGTLVASGNITLRNQADVEYNITLIAGVNVFLKNSAIVANDAVIYGANLVEVKHSATVIGAILGHYMFFGNSSNIMGVVIADEGVTLGASPNIQGSIVTGYDAIMDSTSGGVFYVNVTPFLNSIKGLQGGSTLKTQLWQESGS